MAAWAGVAQRDFTEAFARLPLVTYRDERGTELFDLPGQPLPPESTPLPVRLLGRWDQPLLAYAERERIIPPEVQPLNLTLSGDQTLDRRRPRGRQLAAGAPRDAVRVMVTPHVELRRGAGRDPRRGKATPRASPFPTPAATTSSALAVFARASCQVAGGDQREGGRDQADPDPASIGLPHVGDGEPPDHVTECLCRTSRSLLPAFPVSHTMRHAALQGP